MIDKKYCSATAGTYMIQVMNPSNSKRLWRYYERNYTLTLECADSCGTTCPTLNCSNGGRPIFSQCKCDCPRGFGSTLCDKVASCSSNCSNHGYCAYDNVCECDTNFAGNACESCIPGYYGTNCSFSCGYCGNGQCSTDGTCGCYGNWAGPTCSYCKDGYSGENCTAIPYVSYTSPSFVVPGTTVFIYGSNLIDTNDTVCYYDDGSSFNGMILHWTIYTDL